MKLKLSYIIILLSAIMTYGQVFLSTETNVKETTLRDVVSLTIVMKISGEDYVQESRLILPDLEKFDIVANGSDQKTFIDPVNKVRVNQFIYQLLLQPKQVGNVKIGSALVKVNGKMYKSEPFDILIKPDGLKRQQEKAAYSNDVYLNVKVEGKEIYKNAPVVAVLRVYSKDIDNFRKIKNIHPKKQNNVIVQAINYNRSDIESGGKQEYSSQIIGTFVIFPKEEGEVELPSFIAEIANSKEGKLVSNRPVVNVKKLPAGAPEDFDNFVGNFSLTISDVETLPQPIEINKPIDVVLKMVGKGNLSSKKMPRILETEDYSVFPPKFVKKIKTEREGVVGEIEAHYIVIPKKAGDITIKSESMSFFNPANKKYKELGSQAIVIKAMTQEQISNNKTTLQKVNEYTNNVLETVSTPVIQTKNLKISTTKKINWSVIIANLTLVVVLCGVFLFIRKKLKSRQNAIQVAQSIVTPKITNIEETEALLRNKKSIDVESSLMYLNKLVDQKKYKEFFAGFSELDEEVNVYFATVKTIDFKDYLYRKSGFLSVENYNKLLQTVEIEKYAPLHSDEEMIELMKLINTVFLEIEN